jgi:hypothetical protein
MPSDKIFITVGKPSVNVDVAYTIASLKEKK